MDDNTTPALDELATHVVALAGTLMPVIDHMAQWEASGRSAPDAPPIPEVLRHMLAGVLEPLARRHSSDELVAATGLLDEVLDLICDEFLLVPIPGATPTVTPACERRARGQRRRR